jgi:hypothetical protein
MIKPELPKPIANPIPNRRAANLGEQLFRQLSGYSIAASAAGVAVLACSSPVEASPLCQSLSVTLNYTDTYAFNPANQKVAPFNVAHTYNDLSTHPQSRIDRGFFTPNTPDAKVLLSTNGLPANLVSGASIGPGKNFGEGKSYGLVFEYHYFNRLKGNFQPGEGGYIGFHFSEVGQTHYGWLRVRISDLNNYYPSLLLSEFGYESTPNTAITAGNCAASASSAKPESDSRAMLSGKGKPNVAGSLGMLALGSKAFLH